ncbi:hypothetical protein EX30DRAFT_338109 [Ascodesmis nigricans]|uniref:Cryptic loci regulator 2 N-terminal domain-containing protein n=1 Tax=Ascodesmis nigricans TaxID=341454 RepID=A0A4S2N3F9_9PEZI|nr:hypothetical protein EX30DRAFT_338109 [Ascodesmis nigricans]
MPPGTINYQSIEPPPTDSDGAENLYPDNVQGMPNATPDNFFREVLPNERKHVLYRTEGAKKLVETFIESEQASSNKYMLESFPENYKLYEHNKRQANGKFRIDHYLFGHPSGQRFRSVPEFIPHLLHLAATKDPAIINHPKAKEFQNCHCAYCNRGGSGRASGGSRLATHKSVAAAQEARAMKEVALQERLGEQEMAGWVFRKGEVVWVWLADGQDDDDSELSLDSAEKWGAAAVLMRPAFNTPLRTKAAGKKTFESMDTDEPAPWERDKDDHYCVQLLSVSPVPSDVLSKVPQWHLRPWLSRSSSHHPSEHPSVALAREAVHCFSLFEPLALYPPAPTHEHPRQTWGGLFYGAEKIFLGEPIRIRNFQNPDSEDVMVIDHIYTETRPSVVTEGKTTTFTMIRGSVYTPEPCLGAVEVGPAQFAALPFRMRRGAGDGTTITWYSRNAASERGELAVKLIYGRWYEPVALHAWGDVLEHCIIKRMEKNRAETPGFQGVYGSDKDLTEPTDKKTPKKASLATPSQVLGSSAAMTTPGSGFRSVNAPGSAGGGGAKSRMAMAVEDDQEEDESEADEADEDDEEETDVQEIDQSVFTKSPTKRLPFR